MKRRIGSLKFGASIFICFSFLLLFNSSITYSFSINCQHELGVYSLWEYGRYGEKLWKDTVMPEYNEDPAGAFWNIMTSGTSSENAHITSKKRINSQVNHHTVFPIPGDYWKDWDMFDLVFFYGHNNMITPPHENYCCNCFWSNNGGAWNKINGCWTDWGTSSLPYEYYKTDLMTGRTLPGSVIYLWEPFTSALLGYQFQPNTTSVYQISGQDTQNGNSAGTTGTFVSGLGTNDLEWLILHGCQAVIVANEHGSSYSPIGVSAFARTWDRFHIVLGHYLSYGLDQLRDLSPFAYHLIAGMPVQAAYFLTDPANNTSAISAECKPWYRTRSNHLHNYSYMNTDTWTNPKDDIYGCKGWWIFGDRFIWYVKWIRQVGTEAESWE